MWELKKRPRIDRMSPRVVRSKEKLTRGLIDMNMTNVKKKPVSYYGDPLQIKKSSFINAGVRLYERRNIASATD